MINSPTVPQLDSHDLTDTYFSTLPISKPSLNFIPFIDSTKCTDCVKCFQAMHEGSLPSGIFHMRPFGCNACCFMCLSVKCHHGNHVDLNQTYIKMTRIRQTGFQPKLCCLLSMGHWTDSLSSSVRWGRIPP